VAAKVGDAAKIARVNVDDCPDVAARFSVQSIPTLIVLKDGAEVSRHVGVTQESVLTAAIKKSA
jgi:thioredoxin 1